MNEMKIVSINGEDPENEEFRRLFDSPRQRAERARKMEALNRKREQAIYEEARALALRWVTTGTAAVLVTVGLVILAVFGVN
jgi:hypothetical protein